MFRDQIVRVVYGKVGFVVGVDQVGNDKWWGHIENASSNSPDGDGDSLGDGAREGPLLEGGDVVLGGATNSFPFPAK